MNLRCFYCQTPFTIGRAELLAALQQMDAENLHHYDAHCPRCRRANSVARQRMEMFLPNWRQLAVEQTAMPPAPVEEKPKPAPVAVMPSVKAVPVKIETPAKHSRKRTGAAKKAAVKPAAKPAAKVTPSPKGKKTVPAAKAKAKPSARPKAKTAAKSKKK